MSTRYRDLVVRIPYWIAGVSVIALVVVISAAILARNTGISAQGLQTLAQLIGVWLAFIVISAVAYEERHIEIDYFTQNLSGRVAHAHNVAVLVCNITFCVIVMYGAIQAIDRFWDSVAPSPLGLGGFQTPIPIPLYYLATVLGFALATVVYAVDLATETRLQDRLPTARGDEYIGELKDDTQDIQEESTEIFDDRQERESNGESGDDRKGDQK